MLPDLSNLPKFLPKIPSFKDMYRSAVESEALRAVSITAAAVGLVILSFQALWVATLSLFTLQFFLMPLYFVITCAMIVLGIHALERHEPTQSR